MNILITGCAGFIGFSIARELCKMNLNIYGIDNLSDYYNPSLKEDRVNIISKYSNFKFIYCDICDKKNLFRVFSLSKPDIVLHLAAQAGVRFSIENPFTYGDTNLVGFLNVIEASRQNSVKKFIYASSSSIYGLNNKLPFSEYDSTNKPASLYAATKKANELIAHSYSHLFNLKCIGLRFFTVYGPWGRPDMAIHLFTQSILDGAELSIFNNGDMSRDFTYIDDLVKIVVKIIYNNDEGSNSFDKSNFDILNIGSGNPVRLSDYIKLIEKSVGKRAKILNLPMQLGDIQSTFSCIDRLKNLYGPIKFTRIEDGIPKYVEWHKQYYFNT